MRWLAPDVRAGYQYSECRRYSVCRIDWYSKPYYEAWRTLDHRDGRECVATGLGTSQAARQAAEDDDRG